MDHRRILRFGISTNGKRSPYWQVRAKVTLTELFLEREGSRRQWHLSLHASGQWHLKIRRTEQEYWTRPAGIVPG